VDLATPGGVEVLERFLALNGPAFYGFPPSERRFGLTRETSVSELLETAAGAVTPLPLGLGMTLTWRLEPRS
jgi:dihydroorotase